VHSFGTGEIVIAAVVLVWVVVRQVQARPVVPRTMFAMPAVLAVLGLLALAHDARTGHGLTSSDAAWIAADLALSVVTGAVRAPAIRLFERDGRLWRQGGPLTIALWLASIGLRAGIGVLAARAGAGTGPGDTLLLSFGVSLAVQYAVLALRARRFKARVTVGAARAARVPRSAAGAAPPAGSLTAASRPAAVRSPALAGAVGGRLARAGRWSARHPWWLIGAWLLVLVAATVGHKALGGTYSDNFTLPGSPAAQGAAVLQAHNPDSGGQSGQLVFTVPRGSLAQDKTAVENSVAQVRKLPYVLSASDPLSPATTSKNDQTAYSTVHFSVDPASLAASYITQVNNATAGARSAGVAVSYGGQLGQADQPKSSDLRSEAIGIVAAVLVLLLGFGSVYAAGLPLVTAIVGAVTGIGVLGMAASATTFASVSPTLGVMMGLGVGIDYALFLTTRHRQLVMDGADPAGAAGATIASSGRSVLIAAATVIIALLGLYASGITFIGKLGLAAAITVAVAALCAVTLVPALLGLAGRGIDRRRVRRPVAESAGGSDFWHRYARWIGRHRWLALGGGVAVLLVLAAPVLSLQLGHVDAGASPDSYSSKRAYDAIDSAFGPGANGPLTVVAQLDKAKTSTPAQLSALESSLSAALAKVPDVASVSPVHASADGDVLSATVIPASRPQDAVTRTLADTLQDTTLPAVLNPAGAQGYVTGSLAGQLDFLNDVSQRLPLIIGVVIAAAFLLLLVSFRSPVLALKAAILNFFSIGAAIGVIVAVFQWGWGSSLLGVTEKVPIESYVPMIMFAIVFGLSMDYEVFLLTRVREAWGRTRDNAVSVAEGLSATARVISCAALIITCVFLAFLLSTSVVVKMLALGLGVSVIVDATLIRLLVVPATMFLLGKANWWTPRWLTRLPNLLEPVDPPVQSSAVQGAPIAQDANAPYRTRTSQGAEHDMLPTWAQDESAQDPQAQNGRIPDSPAPDARRRTGQ
jgi:putative drug exporter of the RND superfamily